MAAQRTSRTTASAQEIVQALYEWGLSETAIALLVCCSRSTIWHIRQGQQSGRNILPRLDKLVALIQENAAGRN
jgi:predicted membrane channel-forming protein YqfA (hemolysin III family)